LVEATFGALSEFTMRITKNSVVSFHYTLNDPDGKLLDTSAGKDPFAYIHGNGMIVPGLEEEMEGRQKGDSLKVEVDAAKGYGEIDPSLVQRVAADKFGGQQVEEGMQFQTPDHRVWSVMEVKDGTVVLNGNHPLAGVTLHFSVEVTDVREATAEELSHGHVHGPGGHHH
jgi:FKBP-type peptidyl-prolyl cis-trans isomerase SlyD